MKKILIIISIFLLIFTTNCKCNSNNSNHNNDEINNNDNSNNENNQSTTIKIILNDDGFLQKFMNYSTEYEINKNEIFTFPQLEKDLYIYDELEEIEDATIYTRNIHTFTFLGWEDENNELVKESSIKLNTNKTYTPKYNVSTKTYQVELVTDGVKVNKNNSEDIYNFVLPVIEDENYTFGGWYRNDSYLGKEVVEIPFSNLETIVTLYAKLTPTVNYTNSLILDAYKNGYVKTLFNRKRNIEELKNTNYMIRQSGERIALNTPIQGTSADIMKIAMIKIFNEMNEKGLKSKMLLQVHDELNFSVPKDELEKVKNIIKADLPIERVKVPV